MRGTLGPPALFCGAHTPCLWLTWLTMVGGPCPTCASLDALVGTMGDLLGFPLPSGWAGPSSFLSHE